MADLGYDGKVAIVTGAGGGLGRQHALNDYVPATIRAPLVPAFVLQRLERSQFSCQLYPLWTLSVAHARAACHSDGTIGHLGFCQALWR